MTGCVTMARAKGARIAEDGDQQKNSGSIKIDPELARKVKLIATFRDKSIAAVLDPQIRQFIESEYRACISQEHEKENKPPKAGKAKD